jgi:transcriptional regulator with XRE-family HTH domain
MRFAMLITAGQLRAARGLIGWSQQDLAKAAGIGRATIADFETGKRDPYGRTLELIQQTLERAGVEFTNGHQPGVRMRPSFALEGLEDIAVHLGITPGEAERLCVSGELRAFRMAPSETWAVTREAINEFIAARR